MALIYRSIFTAPVAGGVASVEAESIAWIREKVNDPEMETGVEFIALDGFEVRQRIVEDDALPLRAVRMSLYEDRDRQDGLRIRTTVTAWDSQDSDQTTVWVDVDRWLSDAGAHLWVPNAPRVVGRILRHIPEDADRFGVGSDVTRVARDDASAFLEALMRPDRALPIVVVTRDARGGESWEHAEARANSLGHSLAGVARVAQLMEGAATELSKAMMETVGRGYDVHSGAIRIYLPGFGGAGDWPGRHRIVLHHNVSGRSVQALLARVAGPVHRRASEIAPPAVWRSTVRAQLRPTSLDIDYVELIEQENEDLGTRAEEAQARVSDLEQENVEHLRSIDSLTRRLRYLESRNPLDTPADETALEVEPMDFPSDALRRARSELPHIVLPSHLDDSATALDEATSDESWAQKIWRALSALDAYGRAKARDGFSGDFFEYCRRGEGDIIPQAWIAMHESETTENNPKYRRLRTLPVDSGVHPAGEVFMGSHIKIEQGGYPCPRIHFVDDTSGETGKVHVGWLGDHLENASKT